MPLGIDAYRTVRRGQVGHDDPADDGAVALEVDDQTAPVTRRGEVARAAVIMQEKVSRLRVADQPHVSM